MLQLKKVIKGLKSMKKIKLFLVTSFFFICTSFLYQNCEQVSSFKVKQPSSANQPVEVSDPIAPIIEPPITNGDNTPPPEVPSPINLIKSIPAGTGWYWQLQGAINVTKKVKVYDIDLFETSPAIISSLKASGLLVVCYFSAGTYEDWRPDKMDFPSNTLGNGLGWPGEKWIDFRNSVVKNIMIKRLDLAKTKGCDALEPDNVDGFANNSGFNLTAQDQINFLKFLATESHLRGMLIGLKNATDLVTSLVSIFDFAVVEECFKYNECEAYSAFIKQNKAVLNAEYNAYSPLICTKAQNLRFSTVFFNLDLDGKVFNPCP